MNEKNINLSLELLLLNDLLRTNAIDKDIYDKAAQKIVSTKKNRLHKTGVSRYSDVIVNNMRRDSMPLNEYSGLV